MAEENNVAELTNVKARHNCITKGFEDIYKIEEEIAEKTEEHLSELKALKTTTWRNLKGDVDIPRKVLDLQYRQYKAVRDASDGIVDELSSLIDDLREMHLALHQGETLNWIDAIDTPVRS